MFVVPMVVAVVVVVVVGVPRWVVLARGWVDHYD